VEANAGATGGTVSNTALLTAADPQPVCNAAVSLSATDIQTIAAPSGFVAGDYCTYSIGGWGQATGTGGQVLAANFSTVYPGGAVKVGIPGAAGYSMTFEDGTTLECTHFATPGHVCDTWTAVPVTAVEAILNYLPAGGSSGALTADLVNPDGSSSGVFGGQVLGLQLAVDFATHTGGQGALGTLKLCNTGTSLDGFTVSEILGAANTALGGGPLPAGYTYDTLQTLIANLNLSFDIKLANGTRCVPTDWAQAYLCR
jgi:hypothetical protein